MLRRLASLNGEDWRMGPAPPSAETGRASWSELAEVPEWLPAQVPGDIRLDLVRAGRLPDPIFGLQAQAGHWVDRHHWWIVRDWSLSLAPSERVHLCFRGIDYISDLFLNGHHLARHEGMFSTQILEVTGLLRPENRLAVRILGSDSLPTHRSGPVTRALNRLESRVVGLPGDFPDRRDTLKCQMSYGWDFAPPLRTMGIWDDVYALVTGDLFISDLRVDQHLAGDSALLFVRVTTDSRFSADAEIHLSLEGEGVDEEPVRSQAGIRVAAGWSEHGVRLNVLRPRLWHTWDRGAPDLYRLTVELRSHGRRLDRVTQVVGFRQIEIEGYSLRLNGRRLFARGANWVPPDIFPGRIGEDSYSSLLQRAKQANMNMLRVWGGGLREKSSFYDLCDRMGILVWQELPFACAFLTRFPRSEEYLKLVESESRAIVRDLRRHPSLALWCGGNEFVERANRRLLSVLERAVTDEDPSRPFLPVSPSDGDHHVWTVWHHFSPPSAYCRDTASFASELGLQAPPSATTLSRFIPQDQLWPPGPAWAFHGAGLAKLKRYARPFLSAGADSLQDLVEASQKAQARGLQTAVEHFRRRKALGCGGVLVWQLNEPWPAISWSLIDGYGEPKPAFDTVRRSFSPLLLSAIWEANRLDAGGRLSTEIWVLNDLVVGFSGCRLEVILTAGDGSHPQHHISPVEVDADTARRALIGDWVLPNGQAWRLTCRLWQRDRVLTENHYELDRCDNIKPTLAQRLRARLARLLMPA